MEVIYSVVIATYNRQEAILPLVFTLDKSLSSDYEIIIVDSSDIVINFSSLSISKRVKLIESNRKSQPFQRWKGMTDARGEIIIFLDDDISIINCDIFLNKMDWFRNSDWGGYSAQIHFEGTENTRNACGGRVKPGLRFTPLGKSNGIVQYYYGPFMVFRKKYLLADVFDDRLFDIFESKKGMGEDKVISIRVSQKSNLFYEGDLKLVSHPQNESTYLADPDNTYAREIFSRLYLSSILYKSQFEKTANICIYICIILYRGIYRRRLSVKSARLIVNWSREYFTL